MGFEMKMVFRILAGLFICTLVSCGYHGDWYASTPVKLVEPYVVVDNTSAMSAGSLNLCVAPFESKEWPLDWRKRIAEVYENSLVSREIFSGVRKISWNGENIKDLLYKAERASCDLLLYGIIRKALISGGCQTQGLKIEIWIVDSSNRETLYHVEQMAYSVPGSDRDWFWNTSVGTRSAGIDRIAMFMASQFSDELKKSIIKHSKQQK